MFVSPYFHHVIIIIIIIIIIVVIIVSIGEKNLKAELQSTSMKGHKRIKPVGRRRSFVNDPDKFKITNKQQNTRDDFVLDHPVILLGM
jgi:hypothetical protein